MVKCKARLSIESCDAKFIAQAIRVDNLPFVRTYYEGGFVITEAETAVIGSMLATLDDILVNVKVANDILCGTGSDEDTRD